MTVFSFPVLITRIVKIFLPPPFRARHSRVHQYPAAVIPSFTRITIVFRRICGANLFINTSSGVPVSGPIENTCFFASTFLYAAEMIHNIIIIPWLVWFTRNAWFGAKYLYKKKKNLIWMSTSSFWTCIVRDAHKHIRMPEIVAKNRYGDLLFVSVVFLII